MCARCTGFVASFYIFRNLSPPPIFYTLETTYQLILCTLFATPITFDWITQAWELRNSNNGIRFFTGAVLGQGMRTLSFSTAPLQTKITLYLSLAVIIMVLGLVGKIQSLRVRGRIEQSFLAGR